MSKLKFSLAQAIFFFAQVFISTSSQNTSETNPWLHAGVLAQAQIGSNNLPNIFKLQHQSYFEQDPSSTVKFYLYQDRSNPSTFQEINNVDSTRLIRIPDGASLKIVIHGFNSNSRGYACQKLKDAFLANTNNPVVCVDWGSMSGKSSPIGIFLYSRIAKENLPPVGQYVGHFIATLRKFQVVSSLDFVHVIGHSLGAQLAGVAGETVKQLLNGEKIGRITGLDPAGPSFRIEAKSLEQRLDPDDAKFVDVIHTSDLFGSKGNLGHADYFPNSEDRHQPACRGLVTAEVCDHQIAIDYYVQSITDREIYGCAPAEDNPTSRQRKCSANCFKDVGFGENASANVRGQFCVKITPPK